MNLFKKKKKLVKYIEPTVSEKVQFKHFIDERLTLAFQSPTVKEVIRATENLTKGLVPNVEFCIGLSKVHPRDQYNKKIGREVAESHLETKVATLSQVTQFDGYAHYHFEFDYTNQFILLLTYGKEIPFLISMTSNE